MVVRGVLVICVTFVMLCLFLQLVTSSSMEANAIVSAFFQCFLQVTCVKLTMFALCIVEILLLTPETIGGSSRIDEGGLIHHVIDHRRTLSAFVAANWWSMKDALTTSCDVK